MVYKTAIITTCLVVIFSFSGGIVFALDLSKYDSRLNALMNERAKTSDRKAFSPPKEKVLLRKQKVQLHTQTEDQREAEAIRRALKSVEKDLETQRRQRLDDIIILQQNQ